MTFRISAIIVTFDPDVNRLHTVLDSIAPQVEWVVVVDNGSSNLDTLQLLVAGFPTASLLAIGKNLGIGAALNIGVKTISSAASDAILLLDQDSIPSDTMVQDLVRGLHQKIDSDRKVAAIGPRFIDRHNGHMSQHVKFAGWRVARVDCNSLKQPVEIDVLITSGSLIPVDVLQKTGKFNENLFIDLVDTDWVLRAQHLGLHVYGDCNATMEHDLGENRRRIWLGRWRAVPIHKPFRYYYMFRNSIWLRGQPHARAEWKHIETIKLLQIFSFMMIFHPQRYLTLRMILQGVWDGLCGKTGKHDLEE
ncbi:glycosyltransferase family 2 protein [Acidithiobacillus thiooxidans]|uniref:glycosyltransferase family 2 protein n=1 Tax=Acidithiobacillus thiooxidans TaxID=930 RepID=UPI001C06CC07|nr:glycosyltransferase family 2 protein [Acidithiobacillus thiooxidans]MBU2839938.1 glycosyltransferase family 2 protein [Acidithiobacillus thiooxidans]